MFVMGCGPESKCADCPRVAHCRSLSSSGLQKEPIHAEMVDVVQGPSGAR